MSQWMHTAGKGAQPAANEDRAAAGKKKRNRERGKKRNSAEPVICDVLMEAFEETGDASTGKSVIEKVAEFIRAKVSDAERDRVFGKIKDELPQIFADSQGHFVIQKFLDMGTAPQRRHILAGLQGRTLEMAKHTYGCRVVQKALETCSVAEQQAIVNEIATDVIATIEDQNGNHVVQKCIEQMPPEKVQFIVDALALRVVEMSLHAFGCRVIQRLIEHCSPPQIDPIMDEAIRNLDDLALDQFGNFVVQHIVEHSSRPGDRKRVIQMVINRIKEMSCHKFASNLVERVLVACSQDDREKIIRGVLGNPMDQNPPIYEMMMDRFGNYVVQHMLELSESCTQATRDAFVWRLRSKSHELKDARYGKHIAAAIDKLPPTEAENQMAAQAMATATAAAYSQAAAAAYAMPYGFDAAAMNPYGWAAMGGMGGMQVQAQYMQAMNAAAYNPAFNQQWGAGAFDPSAFGADTGAQGGKGGRKGGVKTTF